MATKKSKLDSKVIAVAGEWPKVDIGTHLTVTRYENGVTIMEWDDDQLLKEVQEAIASVDNKNAAKKKTKKSG